MNYREILTSLGFRYNKSLGQNFLSDKNLLASIAEAAGISETATVVEIGTGAGALTRELSERAKTVHSFEVDGRLKPVHDVTLSGLENVQVHFTDVLRLNDAELTEIIGSEPFIVVANLPYYITTPVLMRFIESKLPVKSMTVMIQKEVADRLCARENTEEYGAITPAVRLRGDCKLIKTVDRKLFFPSPNVDSALVRVDITDDKCPPELVPKVKKVIRACFAMRRKTLVNNFISIGISRTDAEALLQKCGFDTKIRGEVLSLDDMILLAKNL